MAWSPQNAIEAYLQTLHMQCKAKKMSNNGSKKAAVEDEEKQVYIEPEGLELISALAAGNQAKVIVHVTTLKQGGCYYTPLTIALAVAAKQTGGKLICILPTTQDDNNNNNNNLSLLPKATDVVEFRVGDPCEKIRDLRNVDFVVTEFGFELKSIHLNPKGAIVVANNVVHREQGVAFVDQVLGWLGGKRGVQVESSVTTIPLGSTRVQVIIRIKSLISVVCNNNNNNNNNNKPQSRRHKRFLITFDG